MIEKQQITMDIDQLTSIKNLLTRITLYLDYSDDLKFDIDDWIKRDIKQINKILKKNVDEYSEKRMLIRHFLNLGSVKSLREKLTKDIELEEKLLEKNEQEMIDLEETFKDEPNDHWKNKEDHWTEGMCFGKREQVNYMKDLINLIGDK